MDDATWRTIADNLGASGDAPHALQLFETLLARPGRGRSRSAAPAAPAESSRRPSSREVRAERVSLRPRSRPTLVPASQCSGARASSAGPHGQGVQAPAPHGMPVKASGQDSRRRPRRDDTPDDGPAAPPPKQHRPQPLPPFFRRTVDPGMIQHVPAEFAAADESPDIVSTLIDRTEAHFYFGFLHVCRWYTNGCIPDPLWDRYIACAHARRYPGGRQHPDSTCCWQLGGHGAGERLGT